MTRNNKSIALLALFAVPLAVSSAVAQDVPKVSRDLVEQYVKSTWKKPPEGWQARIDQDETQRVCSETRNQHGDVLQLSTVRIVVPRRPAAGGARA